MRLKIFPLPCLSPYQIITSQDSKQMSTGRKKANFQAEFMGGSICL